MIEISELLFYIICFGLIFLIAFIYISDTYIISTRMRAQMFGGAFKGLSYAMQISYFIRIGIFVYNGMVGVIIDANRNSFILLMVCALLGNILFIVFFYYESNIRPAKILKLRYHKSEIINTRFLNFKNRFIIYLGQFFFQAAWLSPLIANNISDDMKGTALAVGSFVNGFSGFISAFCLEPLMRKASGTQRELYNIYFEIRSIKRNTSYISIVLVLWFIGMYLYE